MAQKIIKGDDLMLFSEMGYSFAFATSHSLSISADAVEISSKDSGKWKTNTVNKLSWEISSENLYTTTSYDELFNLMVSREEFPVFFGVKSEVTDSIEEGSDGWTPNEAYTYHGYGIITSLTANAGTGDNATYSVTITGTGALEKGL